MSVFDDLARPDPRTGHFVPWGLAGGQLTPDATVELQRAVMDSAALTPAVPLTLRTEFDRLRDLHVHGAIRYENFADVCNLAPGLYETALQARFVEFFCDREVPFVHRGSALPFVWPKSPAYVDVFKHIKPRAGIRISTSNGMLVPFSGMFDGLLSWARAEGLLRGQRARLFEHSVRQHRNDVSHGLRHQLEMPPTSAGDIHDLAEFINQLWGVRRAGGRRYPAPRVRRILAIGFDAEGHTTGLPVGQLVDASSEELQWLLVRAAFDYGGYTEFDLRFATSETPFTYIWGPGTRSDAITWLEIEAPEESDEADPLDQLFLIRRVGATLDAPRYPEAAVRLSSRDLAGDWYLMMADHPIAAWSCVRARAEGIHNNCRCATLMVARGSWQKMLHRLADLRPHLFDSNVRYPKPLTTVIPPDIFCEGFRSLPRRKSITLRPAGPDCGAAPS